jgi:hypothetical protein
VLGDKRVIVEIVQFVWVIVEVVECDGTFIECPQQLRSADAIAVSRKENNLPEIFATKSPIPERESLNGLAC